METCLFVWEKIRVSPSDEAPEILVLGLQAHPRARQSYRFRRPQVRVHRESPGFDRIPAALPGESKDTIWAHEPERPPSLGRKKAAALGNCLLSFGLPALLKHSEYFRCGRATPGACRILKSSRYYFYVLPQSRRGT